MLMMSVVMGTRPEIIKLAPVIHAGKKAGHRMSVVLTGQHKEMIYPLLRFFEIKPDLELDVMVPDQGLTTLSEKILSGLNECKGELADSDVMIVQGDTTSALMAAYWGFCHRIAVAHVEAGLRTCDLSSPFPEEGNRQLISRIATLHFAPTVQATVSLCNESVPSDKVYSVGNTSIDALQFALKKIQNVEFSKIFGLDSVLAQFVGEKRLVVVTAHRRESFGDEFEGICKGILDLAESRDDLRIVYPVHPNPNVRNMVKRTLGNHSRILLCEPLPYIEFVALLKRAEVILTDSGGIQEEGPTLRKPILVMRKKTERPEGVSAGFSRLVGTDPKKILEESLLALANGLQTEALNPYGDGESSLRIIDTLTAEGWRKDSIHPVSA